jgi:hypothetical protein
MERWAEEELTRVPPGPSVRELHRRLRARRARRVGSVAAVAIVLAVLGIVGLLQSPSPHRVLVTEPSTSSTAVPTPSTLPAATTAQFPALAKIVDSVIVTVQRDSVLSAGPPPGSAEIVATTSGRAEALKGGSGPHPEQPIYLVQVIGDFVCNDCFNVSAPAPRGRSFQVTFDRTASRGGFSIGAKRPYDLSSLGTVYRLSLVRPLATTAQFPALAKMTKVVRDVLATDSRQLPGSAGPTAEIVETTRARAFPLLGGSVTNLSSHIYVVQVIGNFTCYDCSVPAGAAAPHGRALRVEFDATGAGYGFGVGPAVFDLSTLGTVYGFPL